MTPHIEAKKGDIAKLVLMPGDPLRAEFIVTTYLTNVKKVNTVRNMLMFTGEFQGNKVSVCGSGMGQPSIGIYSYELFKFYDVDTIVRIGSAGSYKADLKIHDLVLVTSAYSDSTSFSELVIGEKAHVAYPSIELNNQIENIAKLLNVKLHKARVHSSDVFYAIRSLEDTLRITEAECVEMESAALFTNAKALNKKAACLLTISDNLITHELISAHERQIAFKSMMEVALRLAKNNA